MGVGVSVRVRFRVRVGVGVRIRAGVAARGTVMVAPVGIAAPDAPVTEGDAV